MQGTLTEDSLKDNKLSVLIDTSEGSNTLIITFGGILHRLPIPVFEFFRSLDCFNVNKVFIRDFSQSWYTHGIKGISENTTETIAYLQSLINLYGKQKTIFIGNSAGAFAALLFGRLLNVSEIHAFSPQTFITPSSRLRYLDFRWRKEMKNLHTHTNYLDLKKVYLEHNNTNTIAYLYWDENHRLDNIHAKRMSFTNVHLLPYKTGGHDIIKKLRNSGELFTIIEKAIK